MKGLTTLLAGLTISASAIGAWFWMHYLTVMQTVDGLTNAILFGSAAGILYILLTTVEGVRY